MRQLINTLRQRKSSRIELIQLNFQLFVVACFYVFKRKKQVASLSKINSEFENSKDSNFLCLTFLQYEENLLN